MKICVLGPIYPYRGGISHYTTLMSKTLSKRHQVYNISYSLQYPKILFRRGEQKDYSNPNMEIPGAQFCLNTINPASWFYTAWKIKALGPDLLIIPWWHPYFAPAYWTILKLNCKKAKILFLCHNVLPHEPVPMQRMIIKRVLKQGNLFLVHSDQEEQQIRELIPQIHYAIRKNPHPTYDFFNSSGISQKEARRNLGLPEDSLVLLFFGFVREYKGLKVLIDSYQEMYSRTGCRLLIVGEFLESEKEEYMRRIRSAEREASGIIVVDTYVPDTDVEKYFAACDLVVLPYLSATQSGVVTIAFGFEKPVIVTKVGGLPEVVSDGKTGYVIPPNDSAALIEAVENFAKQQDTGRFADAIRQESYKFSWDYLADTIEKLKSEGEK